MLTLAQFRHVYPNATDAEAKTVAIASAWEAFGVTTKAARAAFLGIWGNETGGMITIGREDMRYSAERAFQLFQKARAFPEVTRQRCSTVPVDAGRRFASWIYADLYGNGPEATEDGWRFRGGGMTQLTFKSTYAACGKAVGIDLEADPDLITTPMAAALSAVWFGARYKPAVLRYFNTGTDADFHAGGALVGWTNEHHTAVRMKYRARALEVLDGAEASEAPPPARLLYLGVHSGADVGELQRLLAAQGVYRGEIDNDFGELTRAAVVAFQKRTFTAPGDHDGVVGDKTWAALRAAVKVAA